jgi:hypothetical protein
MATVASVEEYKWAELQYLSVYILLPQVIPYPSKWSWALVHNCQYLADYRHHIPAHNNIHIISVYSAMVVQADIIYKHEYAQT